MSKSKKKASSKKTHKKAAAEKVKAAEPTEAAEKQPREKKHPGVCVVIGRLTQEQFEAAKAHRETIQKALPEGSGKDWGAVIAYALEVAAKEVEQTKEEAAA